MSHARQLGTHPKGNANRKEGRQDGFRGPRSGIMGMFLSRIPLTRIQTTPQRGHESFGCSNVGIGYVDNQRL